MWQSPESRRASRKRLVTGESGKLGDGLVRVRGAAGQQLGELGGHARHGGGVVELALVVAESRVAAVIARHQGDADIELRPAGRNVDPFGSDPWERQRLPAHVI